MYVCMLTFLLLTSPCCNSCNPLLLSIVGKIVECYFWIFFLVIVFHSLENLVVIVFLFSFGFFVVAEFATRSYVALSVV
jgi:hypothetical protein